MRWCCDGASNAVTAIRLAIVGLGKIARDRHIPAIADTEGIELVAAADPNASIDGIAHFATLEKLLASKRPSMPSHSARRRKRAPRWLRLR